jgi:hypothetical protein
MEEMTNLFQVIGNTVNGVNYAGIVYIAQRPTQLLQGFISKIDGVTGRFIMNGVEMFINDPVGRYGPPTTTDFLWTSDPDNPSIKAQNGFPVCIPTTANIATCPAANRPKDFAGNPSTLWLVCSWKTWFLFH